MTSTKRLAAYGMAATAAIGGGLGGLALGLGLTGHQDASAPVSAQLAAASSNAAPGPAKPGDRGGVHVARIAVAASAIGMSAADLRTALEGSTATIAQVAKDHNVDEQKVIDALVAAETTALDQAVKDGTLTQAQADQRKAGLAAHIKDEIEHAGPRPGDHGPGGRRGPGGPVGP